MTQPPGYCPIGLGEGDDGDMRVPVDRGLVAAGWVRRHLAAPDRAREAIELYAELGFEVQTRRIEPEDLDPRCQACASVLCRDFVMIYTRRKRPAPSAL